MEENYFTRLKILLKDRGAMVNSLLEAVGMTETQYHSLLRYDNCPRADVAVKIAHFLDTTVEYMVTGQDTNNIPTDIMAQVRKLMALDRARRTPILANIKSQVDFWKTETDIEIIPTMQDELSKEDQVVLEAYHSLSERDKQAALAVMQTLQSIPS